MYFLIQLWKYRGNISSRILRFIVSYAQVPGTSLVILGGKEFKETEDEPTFALEYINNCDNRNNHIPYNVLTWYLLILS